MNSEIEIQIVDAKVPLKPEELELLLDHWIEHVIKDIVSIQDHARESIEEIIATDLMVKRKRIRDELLYMISEGSMIVARVNGEIAGMVRVAMADESHTNPIFRETETQLFYGPFVEIGKALVLPKFRGRRIFQEHLAPLAEELAFKKYPNLPVVVGSNVKLVQDYYASKSDWITKSGITYSDIHGYPKTKKPADFKTYIKLPIG